MRALLCHCRQHLEAENDAALCDVVREHLILRRGLVGRVTARYGGDGYVAVDVRFSGGQRRLFRPEDLEEISPPRPWWRSLLHGNNVG